MSVEITDQEAAVTEAAEVAETTILHDNQEADHLALHIKVVTTGIEATEECMPEETTTVITEDKEITEHKDASHLKEITDKREPKTEEMAENTANRDPDRPEETEISTEDYCNETEYYD